MTTQEVVKRTDELWLLHTTSHSRRSSQDGGTFGPFVHKPTLAVHLIPTNQRASSLDHKVSLQQQYLEVWPHDTIGKPSQPVVQVVDHRVANMPLVVLRSLYQPHAVHTSNASIWKALSQSIQRGQLQSIHNDIHRRYARTNVRCNNSRVAHPRASRIKMLHSSFATNACEPCCRTQGHSRCWPVLAFAEVR
jgi:hypothetical protein